LISIPPSLLSLIGLCYRARMLASGELAAEQSLRKGKAQLLILAADASEKTREKFIALAARNRVPVYLMGTRDALGAALGKAHRAAVVIQSKDFANGMLGILRQEGHEPLTEQGQSRGSETSDLRPG
jgi:ribosomal protein L7Ae-like RNA K-turn-binding protein